MMLTVLELKKSLESFPDDMPVVFCSCSNNPMEYCDEVHYVEQHRVSMYDTWSEDDEHVECCVLAGCQCGIQDDESDDD